jgi:hypothetical protein
LPTAIPDICAPLKSECNILHLGKTCQASLFVDM